VLAHRWQTIPERSVVRLREPFEFWWAPTISRMVDRLSRLQLSSHVSVINFGWSSDTCRTVEICIQQLGRCDTEYLACAEPLRRAGLLAVFLLTSIWNLTVNILTSTFNSLTPDHGMRAVKTSRTPFWGVNRRFAPN